MDANKYQSFLQVDFKTWGNKVSYRVILSLLMGMIKHSHSTQSNKLAISLQYLQKEVRNEVPFLHADKQKNSTIWIIVFDESNQKCAKYAKIESL